MRETTGLSRRAFLADGATALIGTGVASELAAGRRRARWWRMARPFVEARASQIEALRVLGRTALASPGSLRAPKLPAGTDTLPGIDHVVVLMLENHTYDNVFGMLGRGFGQRPRGDGFTLAADGLPDAANPYPDGRLQRAFRMPTTCQFSGVPSQEWLASHNAYNHGAMDGFVRTPISPGSSRQVGAVAMGYWTGEDLPFTYGLAAEFPLADRWFSSCLAQTDPNRRYLIAGTSTGMTDDIGDNPAGDTAFAISTPATIFNRFAEYGITWADYAANNTTGATPNLYPVDDSAYVAGNIKPFEQFFTDAAAGTLPQFTLIDPDFDHDSQENPQNIVGGEAVLARVVRAIGASPLWRRTLFILTYDEGGGYYDHVPPPAALAPDDIAPIVLSGESIYDGFARYGFRVPSLIVSPYAKRRYVSHVVYDHTSILAFVERKWNLPALTLRDANANDLTDMLDLTALERGRPTFPELPPLPAAGDDAARLACSRSGPGTVPAPLPPAHLLIRALGASAHPRGLVVKLLTDPGAISGAEITVLQGRRTLTRRRLAEITALRTRRVVVPVPGRGRLRGAYTVRVTLGRRTLAERSLHVR